MSSYPSPATSPPGVLYVSYDGMLEPLGQSQVINYLEPLAREFRVHLISHEKSTDLGSADRFTALSGRLRASGIRWHPRRYHKRPPLLSTVWDMATAALAVWWIARRERVRIVHARSVLSAAIAWPAAKLLGAKLIVDIRGLWVDERADGGVVARGGPVYRILKSMERGTLRAADSIVTLTHASVRTLREDPSFGHPAAAVTVIPTCADFARFTPDPVESGGDFVVGYVGQIGGWYRFDRMVSLFQQFRALRPGARMLVINRPQHNEIRRQFAAAGVPPDQYEVRAAELHDVPAQVRRMTVALSVNAENYSNLARAPTKLAEYLGCGVPCLSSDGVGDVSTILEEGSVGIVVRDWSETGQRAAVSAMLALLDDPKLTDRCVAVAHRNFALTDGVEAYRGIYRQLAQAN